MKSMFLRFMTAIFIVGEVLLLWFLSLPDVGPLSNNIDGFFRLSSYWAALVFGLYFLIHWVARGTR